MRMIRIRKRNRDRSKLALHGLRAATTRPVAPAPAARPGGHPWADGLSDVSIAGDPLAFPHLARTDLPAHPTTVAEYARLVREIAADRDRWEPLVQYDALTRWYARLETGPGYEVWLLSWLPGQSSGFHDHGTSSGVMTVVRGELVERSLTHTGEDSRDLRPGGRRVFSPGYLHEVVNASLEPAVSIHLYTPGLTEMNQYGAAVVPEQHPQTSAEAH
ncbi:cysteine dioxygenase family protein [Kitasatospora purpeofusca]|nr:cysteine dioxygenase family protein [Kitasatospora purpeofusca]MCX4753092.1 cysteine dioxygenase family protein [Kitasatospora purpeofusca]WSR32622.1 cysteine dioxygenase family protein [Kitasatospora purpeofusca]WSR40712.1 cysteine dioxygenase family protein [Kitasatospora purpeofusca]